MVSLADILNNAKTKVQNNELYNKLLGQEYNQVPLVKELPLIKPVQMREDGSMYEIKQPIEKKPTLMQRAANVGNNAQEAINNIGSKLGNYLLGEQDITSTQGEPIKDENGNLIPSNTISATPRRGGVLRDIAEGYRENRNTPFSIDNLGGRKTFANRFGEAVGTVSRFADSPLGRGLIMAGIVGATGGGALPALAFGGSTSLMNQQNRMKNELYRNNIIRSMQESLKNSPGFAELTPDKQNAQLQKIADSVNAYRGYLGDDTYRQILTGLQLQDNAEYRNALLANNQRGQEALIKQRQAELEHKKVSDAEDRALKRWELKIREAQANGKPLSDTQVKNLKDLSDSLNEAEEIITKYSNSKYDAGFGVVGAARRNPLTSKFDPLASEMQQDIGLFRKTVARAKEGGRLTDQDQKYYEKAVLNPNLSREDFISLAKEFQNKMERQMDTALDMYELQGKNVNNFRNYYENNKATTNEGWAF